MTPALRSACAEAVHVVTADDEVLRAGRASVFVLDQLGFRRSAWLLGSRLLLPFVEVGYRIVARNRKLFSKFFFRNERPD